MKYIIQKSLLGDKSWQDVVTPEITDKLSAYEAWHSIINPMREKFRHVATVGFYATNEITRMQYRLVAEDLKRVNYWQPEYEKLKSA